MLTGMGAVMGMGVPTLSLPSLALFDVESSSFVANFVRSRCMQVSPLWQQCHTFFLTCSQIVAKSLLRTITLPCAHHLFRARADTWPWLCARSCHFRQGFQSLGARSLLSATPLHLTQTLSCCSALGLWVPMACLHPLLINIQASSSCCSSLAPLALSTSRIKGVQQLQQRHLRGWGKQLLQQSPNSACR